MIDSLWVNLAGIGLMLILAHVLAWLEQKPWKSVTAEETSSTNWPAHAALAFGLSALTIAPMLFLTPKQPTVTMAAIPVPTPDLVITPPDMPTLETEAAVFQEPVETIVMPDPL